MAPLLNNLLCHAASPFYHFSERRASPLLRLPSLPYTQPFRISSQYKGALAPPGTYVVIGVIIAVDTAVGSSYTKAFIEKDEAS